MPEYLAARAAAQRHDRRVLIVSTILFVVCLVGGGILLRPINEMRRERQLVLDPETMRGLPPSLELAGKLGPLRALMIDIAFIRYERLKEQGKNYEAYQLAQIISSLQPRFPGVWAYNAWNMAYNISVAYYSPEARWKWVTNGIRELRDKGLVYNPREIALYKELGYIYWHKIADFLDDEHMSYKRAMAVEMERVLGAPPPALSTAEVIEHFRPIAEAPEDLDAFLASDPEAARISAQLTELGLPPDERLLDFVARYMRPEARLFDLTKDHTPDDPRHEQRLAIVRSADHSAALERFLAVVRSKVLREQMRLDPKWMYELMQRFGPIDWRAAWAHALYWSSYGDKVCEGVINLNPHDSMNTVRFIFFALKYAVSRGKMILVPNFDKPLESYIDFMPDARYVPYLFDAYLDYGKRQFGDDPEFREGTPGRNYMSGFFNWVEEAIGLLYIEGGEENLRLATKYYDHLRTHNLSPSGRPQERYLKPLREFVLGNIKEQMETYKQSQVIINGFISAAMTRLAANDVAGFQTNMQAAKECYDYYMVDKLGDVQDRRLMQPLQVMIAEQLIGFLQDPRRHILTRIWLWERMDLRTRQLVWDEVKPFLEELCARHDPPLDRERAFPEPPGMDTFRKDETPLRFLRQKGAEQGERK